MWRSDDVQTFAAITNAYLSKENHSAYARLIVRRLAKSSLSESRVVGRQNRNPVLLSTCCCLILSVPLQDSGCS